MRRKKLLWQLFPYHLLIIVLSLIAAAWYSSRSLEQFYIERTREELESKALLVEQLLRDSMMDETEEEAASLCRNLGTVSKIRVTIVLPDGRVVCDSHEDPGRMENHSDLPEVIRALAGLDGHSIRFSDTLRENFMYVAVPLHGGDGVAGAVRISMPLTFIDESLRLMYMRIFIGGLAVNIAERAAFLATVEGPDIPLDFPLMVEKTQAMLRKSLDVLMKRDADLAHEVLAADDEIDEMNREMYIKIQEAICRSSEQLESLIHLLSCSRHLERIADHATNIAEDAIYLMEGEIVRHGFEDFLSKRGGREES